MIVSLEGPDRCGKSTLLEPLAKALKAVPIHRFHTPPELLPSWPWVEYAYLHLFGELYNPNELYVSDRSPTVTPQVYARTFNRPCHIDPKPWYSREFIVYVDTPLDVMLQRHDMNRKVFSSEMYGKLIESYTVVLADNYTVMCIDGLESVDCNINRIHDALT